MDITSVVSFFRLRPWQGELRLQIPAVFWHNVEMYHWSTRPRCPGFCGNIWTIMAKSRMTAFTVGLSAIFVVGLGKNFNISAFCTLLWDCPFGKGMKAMAGYHNWRLLLFTIWTLVSYVQPSKKRTVLHQNFYFSFVFWKDLFVVCFSSGDL